MTHDEWVRGFWRRVLRVGATRCWPWTGARDTDGYGKLKRQDGQTTVSAHRISAELKHGQRIPGHLVVMHTCDNPRCCNPAHLRVATQRDNVLDMHAKGRAPINALHGDDHGSTKISDADVDVIRDLWARRRTTKVTQVSLARQYGVTQPQISRIVNVKRRRQSAKRSRPPAKS